MQEHLDQVAHNQNFHNCIDLQFSGRFYDWKITVLFYIAIHCLKALAAKKRINIGDTHFEIERSVNPDRPHTVMPISRNAWNEYKALFNYSRTARCTGITDTTTFEVIMEIDHKYCLQHLERFKKYIQGQGVTL